MPLTSMIRSLRILPAMGLFAVIMTCGDVIAQPKPAQAQKDQKKPEATVTLATKPAPPAAGQTTFTVTAKDAQGKPITGAVVSVELVMPPMGGMGQMKNTVALAAAKDPKVASAGTYVGEGSIMMAGKWNVTVSVKVGGKDVAQTKLTLTAR